VGFAASRWDDGIVTRAEDVPSFWEDVILRCDVTSVARDRRKVESFSCRAVNGRRLPAGRYSERNTEWISDLDRRPAAAHEIVMTGPASLVGWASY
jgi:protein involved in temperature-dependent protein secretion